MAAMKRGLPRLVFAPLNRLTPIALNLEPEPEPAARRRLPFSHQTRSEQYLADKTILGRNKSQIAPSLPLLLFANKGKTLCRQNPLLLHGDSGGSWKCWFAANKRVLQLGWLVGGRRKE